MRYLCTLLVLLCTSGLLLLSSCDTEQRLQSHGPIVLGDPSTIVTEQDSSLLRDNVTDFRSSAATVHEAAVQVPDTVATPVQHTPEPLAATAVEKTPAAAEKPVSGKGLQIAFKPFTVFIPGIETRSFRRQDPASAKGVSYSLSSGRIDGNTLQIKGAQVMRVMQRYQTVVILKDRDAGNLLLQALGTYSSEWQSLRGAAGTYKISGIAKSQLKYNNISGPSVKNAVKKAARSNRLSRKEEEQLLRSVHNIRHANQPPLYVVLQSVIWKITAREASGRSVEKELRIDMDTED